MAETQENPGNSTENQGKQPLVINVQYIKDMSFESPHVPQIFTEIREAPNVEIGVDVQASRLENNVFEVDLKFKAESQGAGKKIFIVELVYSCVVTVNVPDEHIEPVLLVEVPRQLFPFARSIIADITRDAGFPALMITPIDFLSLYRQKVAQAQKES